MSTYDVGPLNANPTHFQSGNSGQFVDVFKVKIDSSGSNLNLAIHSLNGSSSSTPEAKIYRDSNHNGAFDQSDSLYDPWDSPGTTYTAFNQQLAAGTYFAVVKPVGAFLPSYSIDFSKTLTSQPSNLIGDVQSLGSITNPNTNNQSRQVSNLNTSDIYSFNIPSKSYGATFTIDGLSDDADIRVFQDLNHNFLVDAGEEIARSTHGGTQADSLNITGTGDYFVQVYQYSGNANYRLHSDWFSVLF